MAIGVACQVPEVMVPSDTVPVDVRFVNVPAAGVVPPIVVWSIVPPVMATALAFCVAIVPRPTTWLGVMEITTLLADVICPWALTAMRGTVVALPYVCGETPVLEIEIVPVVVMGPPVNPVPVATDVTVPNP